LKAAELKEETTGTKAAEEKLEADGFTTGIRLDLSVFKDITPLNGTTITTQLIELPEVIDVTVDIPEELQGKSQYFIYRYHEGTVDVLSTTKNADGEYIEVSSDGKQLILHIKKFSDYVLAYKDATMTAKSPKTGDNTPFMLLFVLALASGVGFVYVSRRKRVR